MQLAFSDTYHEMLVHALHLAYRARVAFANRLGGTMLGLVIVPIVALALPAVGILFVNVRKLAEMEFEPGPRLNSPVS